LNKIKREEEKFFFFFKKKGLSKKFDFISFALNQRFTMHWLEFFSKKKKIKIKNKWKN